MADAPKARVVVLGAGWWTQGWHLPHLHRHPDAEVVAVVDPCPNPRSAISTLQPLTELGEKYDCATFESFDACLASGLAFDGVIVCTSHASHSQLGAQALQHGKHVLMEKPMTTDVREVRSRRPAVLRCLHFTDTTRVHQTRSWVVSFSILRPFGPRRATAGRRVERCVASVTLLLRREQHGDRGRHQRVLNPAQD